MQIFVSEEQLKAATGFERQGDLRKWLDGNGFSYKVGKGGRIVTTTDAVNKAFIDDSDLAGWEPE